MGQALPIKNRKLFGVSLAILIGLGLYVAGWFHGTYYELPWPLRSMVVYSESAIDPHGTARDVHEHGTETHDAHSHDDHSPAGSEAGEFLDLSEVAKKNLGLSEEFLKPIELRSFQQTISVPAIVVDRPGRTRLPISATMNGIVTHIHAVSGDAVEPGDLILEMRLTHEDLVTAQKEYLQSLGDRDIELKEIARIEGAANAGAISNKTLLDRQYNRDKLDSLIRSQKESLRLHGLSDSQVERIATERRLLAEMKVFAPGPDEHSDDERNGHAESNGHGDAHGSHELVRTQPSQKDSEIKQATALQATALQAVGSQAGLKKKHTLVLQDIQVQKGQSVNAGDVLCVLADYAELLIEGQAFENEAGQISKAKLAGWPLSAMVTTGGELERIENLSLSWLNNEIDPATRTFKFFVRLENMLIDDQRNNSGQRHVAWKYRVGQRMQLGVPVAEWIDQIVLPVDAVVRDGVDSYVFQQNGDRFERKAVHEKHRDQSRVVLENDGSVFPGDVVALRGAHQMQMALKSKSGGAVDPHAGHNH